MTHLIDKDALVAEIERIKAEELSFFEQQCEAGIEPSASSPVVFTRMQMLKTFIDTLEVKEVDLEKEVNECWNYVFSALGWDENSLMTMNHKEFLAFAKHFFELGLKLKEKEKK